MNHRIYHSLLLLLLCLVVITIPTQLLAEGIIPSTTFLNIGSFCPGESGTGTVTITNDDAVDVDILNYEFLDESREFSLVAPASTDFPYTLREGESVDVVVQFTPEFDTMYIANLRLSTTSNQTPILDITLAGDGYVFSCPPADDSDNDGISDASDNCPADANPDQEDFDEDGVGDACDNCPRDPNALDVDTDGDGIYDAQSDTDADGKGDICDADNDNDGCTDDIDPNPFTASIDDEFVCELPAGSCGNYGDGYGADCDNCPHEYNPDTQTNDADEDGVGDECDNCPRAQNPFDVDTDDDGIFDAQKDTDGDGLGDACDTIADSDNDGCTDDIDPQPYTASVDDEFVCQTEPPRCGNYGDGYGADCDNCPNEYNPDTQADDADGDGVGDECDNCPADQNPFSIDTNGDNIFDTQTDIDGDGLGDMCDNDNDNDGCPSDIDPDDNYPSSDEFDADGIGSECDNCPYAYNPYQADFDGDGKGNACDNCWAKSNPSQTDSDHDCPATWPWWSDPQCGNACDNCPGEPNISQVDSDNDGRGDACDCDDGIKGEYENGVDCGGPCPTCSPCELDELPASFDWRDYFEFPDARNQAACGSCWAFSALGAMEMTNIVKHGSVIDDIVSNDLGVPGPVEGLAEQELVSSCITPEYSCNGGWHYRSLYIIQQLGIGDEECFSYQSGDCLWDEDIDGDGEADRENICCDATDVIAGNGDCSASCDCGLECSRPCGCDTICTDLNERWWTVSMYKKVSSNIDEMKRALICHGPLSASSRNWKHAITIVGYDDNLLIWYDTNENNKLDVDGSDDLSFGGWIIRNSWGLGYQNSFQGEGYGAIPYEDHPYSDINEKVYSVGGIGESFIPSGLIEAKGIALGNVDGIGPDEIIHADALGNMVHIYDKDGILLNEFALIFDEGDELAAGDVNSDGKDEIIHADATNWIRVYTRDGTLLNEFISLFKDSDSLAVGDVTGDREAEIIKGESPFGFRIYNRFGTLMFEKHLGDFSGADRIAVGNLRDEFPGDEIIMGDVSANRIFIYDETGTLESSLLGSQFSIGDTLAAGNVDGYLEDEVIHSAEGGSIKIIDFNSRVRRKFDVNYQSGDAIISGDVTGDGKAEIIEGYNGRPYWIHIYRY